MRTAPKVALSLLLSILLFSGLAAAAYAGLFNILETRFYQPAVIGSMEEQLTATAEAMKTWHARNRETFGNFTAADPVKRSLLPNQSAQDIFDRSNLAGTLMADMNGLDGIRIIDAGEATTPENDRGTRRIHFSTFKEDILKRQDLQISYENYGRNADDVPFTALSIPDGSPPKLLIDKSQDLFLYCFPFYDAFSSWRGTAVFYVSARAAAQYLIGENLFRISDDLALIGDPGSEAAGTVTGMPRAGQQILAEAIVERWQRRDFTTDRIVSTDDSGWVLLSRETGEYGFTGQLVRESLFVFPQSVRLLFLAISFLTLFLVIFLLFNLKQDEMMLIRNRIKRFHAHLLSELLDKNEEVHWDEIKKTLSGRKNDIASEIKKSFGRRMNKKHGAEIDALLDRSWDEILSALGQQESKQAGVTSTDELRSMLEQVLQNNAISLNLTGLKPAAIAHRPERPAGTGGTDEIEEMEEIGEAESVEELDEAEEVSDMEEIGEAESVEELDEAEEVSDMEDIGEAESVEEPGEPDLAAEFAETGDFGNIEALSYTDELGILDEVPEALPDMNAIIDGFDTAEDDEGFNLPEVEPEEVIYLDGEWEPALLEVATEEELTRFIEEKVPDSVLVYNFEQTPKKSDYTKSAMTEAESEVFESVSIIGLDFTSLDSAETEEAADVVYIDKFQFSQNLPLRSDFAASPVYEYLEVLGDEEPGELVDIRDGSLDDEEAVMNRDGLFMVSIKPAMGADESIDAEFQKLVDSVLL